MKLITRVLLWLLSKIAVVAVTILFIVIFYFAKDTILPVIWDWLRDAETEMQIQKIQAEVDKLKGDVSRIAQEITAKEDRLMDIKTYIKDLKQQLAEECDLPAWYHPIDRYIKKKECEARSRIQEEINKRQNLHHEILAELNAKKETRQIFQEQLHGKEDDLTRLKKGAGGYLAIFIRTFLQKWYYIWPIILLVFGGPPLVKILWYYGFAHFAEKAKPIQLSHPDSSGEIRVISSAKNLTVSVKQGYPLFMRMHYISQHDGNLKKRNRFFWKWRAPFISYAAGLFELTQFSVKTASEEGRVVLSSGTQGTYLTEIDLKEHPGFVVHPMQIVGISGNLNVKTKWELTRLHSWLTGQFRYIIFYGTGKLYLEGHGGIEAAEPHSSSTKVEEHLVVGFDTRLAYATSRTETFWPYFRNKALLIDDRFSGSGIFLRHVQGNTSQKQTELEKKFNFLANMLSLIGKFFGF